jgi:putative sigma-54 modulation protein
VELEPSPDQAGPNVVKIKRFDMAPMFEEDAVAQMLELGHAFFVYHDAETDEVSVVYRRADGNFGVIQPVIDRSRSLR